MDIVGWLVKGRQSHYVCFRSRAHSGERPRKVLRFEKFGFVKEKDNSCDATM